LSMLVSALSLESLTSEVYQLILPEDIIEV
jgi:hypothetical protein